VQLVKDPLGIASTPAINNSPLLLGDADLRLSLAGDGFPGIVEIEVDLSAATGADLEWLRFDWPADGDSGALPTENPTSRATFGIYRGRDSIIYMRESY
ncbi:MAG: MSHA biogenesis protein MshQ, partial [Myxococcota bacterium]